MTSNTPSLSVVVFAYNEEQNIKQVLGELIDWTRTHRPDTEIVFVDDGSTDRTNEEARGCLASVNHQLLSHTSNRGIGAAMKTGVLAAKAPMVTFMPADGQIEPAAIETLCQAKEKNRSDVVFSVYNHRDDGFERKVLSWGVRALIRLIHGVTLKSDGPYLFDRKLFIPEQLPPNSFFLNFEFPIRVLAAGLDVATVTIQCRPRKLGKSKSTGIPKILRVASDLIDLRMRRIRALFL